MTRKECLEQAMGCVLRDRNNSYGGPEDSFGVIANFWSVYLGRKVYPHDVAMMMALLKVARIRSNKTHADSFVDLAGYAACGAELAGAEKAREVVTRKWGEEYKKLREQAEGGCCQKGKDHSPEASAALDLVSDEDLRPAPKAEGCEELVFNESRMRESMPSIVPQDGPSDFDAPQTPQELYRRIIANNPATYGTPHKPTGEELAEMAGEETHG